MDVQLQITGSGDNVLNGNDEGTTFSVGSGATGLNTLNGGSGADIFRIQDIMAEGSVISGGGDDDTLDVEGFEGGFHDVSVYTLSGLESLSAGSSVLLTASQLGLFSAISAAWGTTHLIAVSAGTYDLSGKTLSGDVVLDASWDSADVTLVANVGGSTLISSFGESILVGGAGNDRFDVSAGTAGSVTGGGGSDVMVVNGSSDISSRSITGVDALEVNGEVMMTVAQLDGFSTISSVDVGSIVASGAGTYDLSGKVVVGDVGLDASQTSDAVTLIANDVGGALLIAGTGTNTLIGGIGDDFFDLGLATTGTVTGNGGDDWVGANQDADISGYAIAGVGTLAANAEVVRLTAAQLAAFSTIYAPLEATSLQTAGAGTYDLSGKTLEGEVDLDASEETAGVTLDSGGQEVSVITGGAGNDTMRGGGYTTYRFNEGFGQDTIINTGADGIVDILGLTKQDLWFQQTGDDLEIDVIGSSDKITLADWFADPDAQVAGIHASDAELTSQVAQLVTAMATYSSGNPSFDPSVATVMPTDTALQLAINSSWNA